MIARKIQSEVKNDCYRALAYYAGAADHEGEKLLYKWHSGCISDEFDLAIREVEAIQNLNTTSEAEKTYHLMVSVRPEDESKLTPEIWQEIELAFAVAMGFEEHQRHCGVHKNTANLHMHVAYNMIHPQTYNRHAPYYDYPKRNRVCRELEKRYGLVIDVKEMDQEQSTEPKRGNDKARTIEAHTGQQSFDGYVQERKGILGEGLAKAGSWEDLHVLLARHGLKIVLKANGCEIRDIHDRRKSYASKASAVGREFSKGALEKRFGIYVPPGRKEYEIAEQYSAKPMQVNPERDGLYEEFLATMERKKSVLEAILHEKNELEEAAHKKWAAKRHELEHKPGFTHTDRMELLKTATMHEKAAIVQIRENIEAKRKDIREDIPFGNWAGFLQMKAEAGNEVALAILRSRQKKVDPEKEKARQDKNAEDKKQVEEKNLAMQAMREKWNTKRKEIRSRGDMTYADRRSLMATSRMYQLIEMEKLQTGQSALAGFTFKVDAKGTVLFTLPSGGLIRDNGTEITFSVGDPLAMEAAKKMARLKFGPRFSFDGNIIKAHDGIKNISMEK